MKWLILNNTLKHISPDNVKVSVRIDDIRLKSKLKSIRTLIFTKNLFFYTILGFTRSRFYPLDNIDGFHQLIAGSYKSDKPFFILVVDKFPLKADCIDGSVVNGCRLHISYSFGLTSPPGHKIYQEPGIKLFKKINKSVLSRITFCLEDDDHKPVDFHKESITFTYQLINLQYSYLYTYH